ncbi:MarR family EPS-associated transcriptional regulator [Gammaproteobacteria bacterium]|nr:MarR family EPS-associated transcriptional regulator [Gammaproteobacteria bacterium]
MEKTAHNEVRFRLLTLVQEHPGWSQRQYARAMDVSLGKLNYCLRAMTERGFIEAVRFARSRDKSGYRYLLTPNGLAEKTDTMRQFLQVKEQEFEAIKQEIAALKRELKECVLQKST